LNAGVVDDLREVRAFLSRSSLPGHGAGKGQAMHQVAMVVHPLTPFIEIVVERIGIDDAPS